MTTSSLVAAPAPSASPLTSPIIVAEDTPVGPLRLTLVAREPADVATFGGPPFACIVESARTPAEFMIDGHPYGGAMRIGIDGVRLTSRLYRASCFGRSASEVEEDVRCAAAAALVPHVAEVAEWGRQQVREMIVATIRRWDAVAAKYRTELTAAEANATLAREHLLTQCGEVYPDAAASA